MTTRAAIAPLTCRNVELSTIHRPYYHHPILISILTGESEPQP